MSLAGRLFPDPALAPLTSYLFARAGSTEPAFTFLDYSADLNGTASTLTWAELAKRVQTTAAQLSRVTSAGQRVAVLAPQDLHYVVGFLGALHAGTIAVPLFAPEVSQHGERLVSVLCDCEPEVWLTTRGALGQVRALAEHDPVPMPKQILVLDEPDPAVGKGYLPPRIDLDAPAYLQYT